MDTLEIFQELWDEILKYRDKINKKIFEISKCKNMFEKSRIFLKSRNFHISRFYKFRYKHYLFLFFISIDFFRRYRFKSSITGRVLNISLSWAFSNIRNFKITFNYFKYRNPLKKVQHFFPGLRISAAPNILHLFTILRFAVMVTWLEVMLPKIYIEVIDFYVKLNFNFNKL